MAPTRVLASTTSHKREPLLPTLDVFARLGLREIDLNLHHILDLDVPVDAVAKAAAANGQRIRVVSGGWCDFFHGAPKSGETDQSVARQVEIAGALGVDRLRLFFGRLERAGYTDAARATVVANLHRLSDRHPAMTFVFENHDGASLDPAICRDILERTGRPNIRMNFDPINFEKAGVTARTALDLVRPFIGHVHVKGLKDGHYWEFGDGDVDLTPVLKDLLSSGYAGFFTVEYEGPFDGTVRLYQSVERVRALIEKLVGGGL